MSRGNCRFLGWQTSPTVFPILLGAEPLTHIRRAPVPQVLGNVVLIVMVF